MKVFKILIPILASVVVGTSSYFVGRKIGIKKITNEFDSTISMGNLNLIPTSCGTDIYLQLKNEDIIDEMKKHKYVVFSVVLADEKKLTQHFDA